jgi:hypothetical protein
MNDQLDHQKHAGQPEGIEHIEVVENMNFLLGNALQHICRAAKGQTPLENLKQAAFYIAREIARMVGGTENNVGNPTENVLHQPKEIETQSARASFPAHNHNPRKKARPRILTDADKIRIAQLFKEGKKLMQISDIIGKPASAVKNVYYTLANSSMPDAKGSTVYENGVKVTKYPPGYAGGANPQISAGIKR